MFTSSFNEITTVSWEKGGEEGGGGGGGVPPPFILKASGQIFKDGVNVFFSYFFVGTGDDSGTAPRCLAAARVRI
jgi:hypothetical protein